MSGIEIKSEKQVDDFILEVLRQHPEGCSQEQFERDLGSIPLQSRADALNRLLSKSRIQLFNRDGNLLYKEVSAEDAVKFRGLTNEELMLYQIIKQSGNTGLWTKDMKIKTNLAQPNIQKILKTLETRKLVKSVKNINNPSRKVFMLFDLEPSREVTGGAWYTENQFDAEYIEVLREACFQYIQRQGDTTLKHIAMFVRSRGFSKVELREEDILSIVNTLLYDGRVDQVDGEGAEDLDDHFRPAVHSIPATTAFTSIPCGTCPVLSECKEGGLISPQTCVYFDKFLEF
ncbi:hypothetical protein CEUSTIGMA_g2951.t1 [Chlamydomonas eustigma]|uniref:DNA-directed RNA polymerase III subunit RPC6 n=1 Tax=Chlamydomonas eustigma TaxID=1157962 RepID=A0A250WXE1_9CHLO|nr:hypothetical protein CEUSTIGMA_g2951.t1 [Chlamydomonas eustigma]|eukprot:GAX75508.1 hypothetical protein CEUSTIGMA_g2951.t1 [Chlamydomonas eustigma]